jgi:hypothetical protein
VGLENWPGDGMEISQDNGLILINMNLKSIKTEMKNYRDLYGGSLLDCAEIDSAQTKEELEKIIENHRSHMEAILSDANGHLDRFKKRIWLSAF